MKIQNTKTGYILSRGNERFKISMEEAWQISRRVDEDGEKALKECEKEFNPEA